MKKKIKPETSLILPVTPEFIDRRIYVIREVKVLLDSDLAELYQTETRLLNRAVQRNLERFPKDFMFQLSKEESQSLISQIGISKKGKGGSRYLSYAFTELGVAMLSSVLNSDRAVQMNIYIMRAFVKLREIMASNAEIAEEIKELEKGHKENKEHIIAVASTLKRLMNEGAQQKNAIGYVVNQDEV